MTDPKTRNPTWEEAEAAGLTFDGDHGLTFDHGSQPTDHDLANEAFVTEFATINEKSTPE